MSEPIQENTPGLSLGRRGTVPRIIRTRRQFAAFLMIAIRRAIPSKLSREAIALREQTHWTRRWSETLDSLLRIAESLMALLLLISLLVVGGRVFLSKFSSGITTETVKSTLKEMHDHWIGVLLVAGILFFRTTRKLIGRMTKGPGGMEFKTAEQAVKKEQHAQGSE